MDWVWWKHGVLYQIYPRSFYDSNNDGIGDLPGLIEKLDYLADLGIDGIWLSPINVSPMHDFGYDISNYLEIDPIFGTREDFLRLIEEAHRRGIRVIMDLVMNHTSHLHSWFLNSRSSRSHPQRDWYIWRSGKRDKPPNNWFSVFGGSAWKWDELTRQYYLHSFLEEQPDVNWRNKKLKEAMFDVVRFWLDRGVDGFRLDVVNWFIKDRHFRNNPIFLGPIGPVFLQKHKYDRNRPETHDLLKDFRNVLDVYDDRMAVGEVFTMPPGDPALSAKHLGNGEDQLHLAFDFSLMYRWWNARQFYKAIKKWMNLIPGKGWPCHVLSNHDQPRSISRYGDGRDGMKRAKVAATLLLTMKGTPFIYYGEEIGMKNNTQIPRKDICDPLGKRYWPFFAGRDASRTPMQWTPEANAGFTGGRMWLPVGSDYNVLNVQSERADRYSLLNYYRALIAIRKEHEVLQKGEWEPVLKGRKGVLGYFRTWGEKRIFVVLNFTGNEKKINLGDRAQWEVIHSTHRFPHTHFTTLSMTLSPYEATVVEQIGAL